jgi:hypothetical protein
MCPFIIIDMRKEHRMRYAVQYETQTGTIGLMIFTVEDDTAAQTYVTEMVTKHGHTNVSNLSPLPSGASIQDLYRLFPRLTGLVKREEALPTRTRSYR